MYKLLHSMFQDGVRFQSNTPSRCLSTLFLQQFEVKYCKIQPQIILQPTCYQLSHVVSEFPKFFNS